MGLTARGRVERGRIDPEAIKALGNVLHRAPVWAMVGERDRQDLRMVKQTLGPVGDRLEVHVIPGVALHSFRSSYAQGEALARTLDWVSRMLVRTGAVGRGGVQGPRRLSAYTEEPLR
jgi:hypothetical protein